MKLRRVLLLSGALAILLAPMAAADKVYLRDDRVIEGTVVEDTRDQVTVRLRYGDVTFPRDNVVRIDYELTAAQILDKAVEGAKSAEDCLEAARTALAEGVAEDRVRAAYEKATRLDPTNREAHEALGHIEVDGEWLTDDASKRAAGWLEYEGELMPPEKVREIQDQKRRELEARAGASRDAYLKELKGVPWGAAHIIETDHYIIKCNSSKVVAQRYADFMEQIYSAYDEVFKGYKKFFTGKSTIYIFRSVKDFQEYGGGQPGVGGFYMPKSPNENHYPSRIVSAYHGTFGTTGDTREVLAHEGTHQFQHILCDGSPEKFLGRPAWWIEGLAVYFGDGYKFENGKLEIGIPRDRLMVLQQYLKSGQVMPISQFIRLPYRNFSMMAGVSYPYGWSLCHYFLHRGEKVTGRGRSQRAVQEPVEIDGKKVMLEKVFNEFFDFVLASPPSQLGARGFEEHYAAKLEQLLGFPIDKLTEDWKQYVLGIELEKLGEVTRDGKKYVSEELAFEVANPGEGWEWRLDEAQGREAVRIENPATSGLVIITAQGNMDNSPLEELKQNAERGAAQKLESIYVEASEEIRVSGFRAFEFFYEGKEVAPLNATREIKVRPTEQRYRHIVVSTLKRSYEIVMQADKGRFEENKAAFDAVVQSFRMLE